jgi:acyl carrier protein
MCTKKCPIGAEWGKAQARSASLTRDVMAARLPALEMVALRGYLDQAIVRATFPEFRGDSMPRSADPKIAEILKQVAELPDAFEVTDSQEFQADLGIDSLKLIDVVMHIEAALDVQLDDEVVRRITTVGHLEQYVDELAAR